MELICPAGTPASLEAAVEAGADAVYCGFRDETNARNFPGLNFSREELRKGIAFAHRHGVRVLVAINTFARAGSFGLWQAAIDDAAAAGADALIGWRLAMSVDALFLLLLAASAAREIVAGRNWRNLKVVVLIGLLLLANLAFHFEARLAGSADFSRRFAIAVVLLLVGLVAGRIVPSFTRNWLAQRRQGRMPSPFGLYDKIVLAVSAAVLALWVALPDIRATGVALAVAAGLHLFRLARWAGDRTWRNPLLVILHVGYLFIPLGFTLTAAASLGIVAPAAGLHAWTAGAFGIMTLAVMSRASLGHTGRPLVATTATQFCYVLVTVGTVARICSALGHGPVALLHVAGLGWSLGFLIFAAAYWQVLTGPRLGAKAAPAQPN